jgi:hypothetical protein
MQGPSQSRDPNEPSVVTQAQLRRERLRLASFTFSRAPNGQCTAEVQLEWLDDARVTGRSTGQSSPTFDMRIAAEATLNALAKFVSDHGGETFNFQLLGVKSLHAFDANVVIVSVGLRRADGQVRVLGCHLAEEDLLRSTVIAILNATNRVVGGVIAAS